jgi:hypothetical protein
MAAAAFPAIAAPGAGENLIRVADTSACTGDSAAATTLPGWTIVAGSPALLCMSFTNFATPLAAAVMPGLIGSGPYGPATLERTVDLGSAGAAIDRGQARFRLSGWLAASAAPRSSVSLTAVFDDAAGHPLGVPIRLNGGNAAAPGGQIVFQARSAAGPVPAGARSIRVTLEFTGPRGHPNVGYADRLALKLLPAPGLSAAPPDPPLSTVPAFDHVFLIMMENTDYGQVVGDTRNAPYINGLIKRGTLLARYNAVYHPSDQNYLAVASGNTWVRGPVYFPKIHISVRHLGDLIEAAGKTWMAYEQGMGTPCNTTTKYDKYYEPDDAPFVNFVNIIENPSRCRAHLRDTKQLASDLRSAATTPAFAWIAADDYYDGEVPGNGSPASLRIQDGWLKRTLEPVLLSPAWRTRRCLLILTWDESDSLGGNHIATILLGSRRLVRSGYVSYIPYDHYSTARTIEAALGLPGLTANDRYARPINDAFTHEYPGH